MSYKGFFVLFCHFSPIVLHYVNCLLSASYKLPIDMIYQYDIILVEVIDMKTEDIIQNEVDSFMDAFYCYLIKDGMYQDMPESLKVLFKDINEDDISYILDGIEEEYFDDYTYFRSEVYDNEVYWAIPYGEIEVEKDLIDKADLDDWSVNNRNEYAYYSLPAITIVYDLDKVRQAIEDFKA